MFTFVINRQATCTNGIKTAWFNRDESYHLPYQNLLSSSSNCETCVQGFSVVWVPGIYFHACTTPSHWGTVAKIAHTVGGHIIFGAWIFQRKMVISRVHLPFAPTVLLMTHAIAHKFIAMNNHYNSNYNDSTIRMWNEQQIIFVLCVDLVMFSAVVFGRSLFIGSLFYPTYYLSLLVG